MLAGRLAGLAGFLVASAAGQATGQAFGLFGLFGPALLQQKAAASTVRADRKFPARLTDRQFAARCSANLAGQSG